MRTAPPRVEARPVGRPPTTTREAVLEAALAVGLGELSIRKLAAALSVAPSSIYMYYASREALVADALQLALSRLRLPAPQADDWRAFVEAFTDAIARHRAANPAYLTYFLKGLDASLVQRRIVEQFVEGMAAYGIGREDALWLIRKIGSLTLVYAAEATHAAGTKRQPASDFKDEAIFTTSDAERNFHELLTLVLEAFKTRLGAAGAGDGHA